MTAFAIDKLSKEHREVYTTDETYPQNLILSRSGNGAVVALNGNLRVYVSDLIETTAISANTNRGYEVTIPDAVKTNFCTMTGDTAAWRSDKRTIVLCQIFPDDLTVLDIDKLFVDYGSIGTKLSFRVANRTSSALAFKFKYIIVQIS